MCNCVGQYVLLQGIEPINIKLMWDCTNAELSIYEIGSKTL